MFGHNKSMISKVVECLVFFIENHHQKKGYRKKIEYTRTPSAITHKILGDDYNIILVKIESMGCIKRLRREKTKYKQDYHDYEVNEKKINQILKSVDKNYLNAKNRKKYEDFCEEYYPAPKDRKEAASVLRKNLRKTTLDQNPITGIVIVDQYGKRFHHLVSRLKKDRKKDLRIDGQEVVNIDIHQIQIMIMATILENHGVGNDFVKLAMDHDFYTKYGDVLEENFDISLGERKKRKTSVFRGIFGHYNSKASKLMFKIFPGIKEFVTKIKKTYDPTNPSRKIYSNFNRMMQLMESDMINEVILKLDQEQIPVLSIHDSIVVPKPDQDRAYEIFNEIAQKYLIKVKLNIEE